MKLPEWMNTPDSYVPPGGSLFAVKTIRSLGRIMSDLRVQRGHEKARAVPALIKIPLLLAVIITVSAVQSRLVLLAFGAVLLGYLCIWPARDILSVVRPSAAAGLLAAVLLLPALIAGSTGPANSALFVAKVVLCVMSVSIFNHTTQWYHITAALRKLHVPGVFVFALDITLRYIVLLGRLICDLLTSLSLRSVGKARGRYGSVGGVMGVTFVRGAELNRETYEAMRCRGFTDDYSGL
ncbi:MAG: energy-coupling factor transporter transmembrane protein EcfT [Lachnospiraceae bacterium]|nr:energy-coupling factor transporter transmembrane protein EcfT [Lachnospiraceae bacterium]